MQKETNEQAADAHQHQTLERRERIASRILGYLQAHPEACDNVEGITRWWLLSQQINETVREVEQALEELREQGLVRTRPGAQHRLLYCAGDLSQGTVAAYEGGAG